MSEPIREGVAASGLHPHDFSPKPADPVRVQFDCGHSNWLDRDEYGDGSAWCNACGEFVVYARCLTCHSLDCQSIKGPTLAHEAVDV